MRTTLLSLVGLLLGTGIARADDPPLPPIVFQTQPLGRVVTDVRAGAEIIGGEKGTQAFNEGLKKLLGEKGFQGLDLSRPLVGYVVLAPKPEDITAVVAFPVTTAEEFLALCDRVNKDKLKVDAKDKTLYHMPPLDPRYKALMRFKDRYAYIAYGAKPMPHIDAKALVPMDKLFDPAEPGLVAACFHIERVPLAVKLAAFKLLEEVKKSLFNPTPLAVQATESIDKALSAELEKLVGRYIKYAADVDTIAARASLDVTTGNVVVEATLSGKPNTELAKTIAAFKPTANKFGALLDHKETLGGFKLRLPLFDEGIRNLGVAGLAAGEKEGKQAASANSKTLAEEIFKGLTRTVKTGEFDIVGAIRGPDKDGWYTVVGAVAFEDPSKVETAYKDFIKNSPPEVGGDIKWDVAKAGKVSIHTMKFTPGGFIDVTKVFGGENCSLAFAFAPHGVFAVMGPDSIATLKDALAVKPAPAPVFDLVINPLRTTQLIRKVMGEDDPDITNVENVLGKEDKLVSVMSATLEGGKELRAAFTINLKVLPRAAAYSYFQQTAKTKPIPPK